MRGGEGGRKGGWRRAEAGKGRGERQGEREGGRDEEEREREKATSQGKEKEESAHSERGFVRKVQVLWLYLHTVYLRPLAPNTWRMLLTLTADTADTESCS